MGSLGLLLPHDSVLLPRVYGSFWVKIQPANLLYNSTVRVKISDLYCCGDCCFYTARPPRLGVHTSSAVPSGLGLRATTALACHSSNLGRF